MGSLITMSFVGLGVGIALAMIAGAIHGLLIRWGILSK